MKKGQMTELVMGIGLLLVIGVVMAQVETLLAEQLKGGERNNAI